MWRNYLTVGIRSLAKSKTYSFITIFGLAIGMAACLMILLFVRYELSYDSWLPEAENTYQFQTWWHDPSQGPDTQGQMSAYAAGPALKKDFPQVERFTYLLSSQPVILKDGQPSMAKDFIFTDSDALAVIDLPLLRGGRNALATADSAVLTQSEAVKRFGTDDIVGKTLTVISKGVTHDYRITGVLKDLPKNSHLRISTMVRVDFPSYLAKEAQVLTCWGCNSGWVYARLKPGTDVKTIDAGMPAWEKRNIPDQNAGEARFNAGDVADWHLVNVRDVHLGKAQEAAMAPGNDRSTIVTFAVIALLILGMAVVNFINLATARANQRAREVALRKVLGATRQQLIGQFIGESVIVAVLAAVLALALVELLMPAFASFLDADLKLSYFGTQGISLPVVLLVLVVGVLGGLYPAFFLSRFHPASVLKANRSSAETPGSGRLRTILVVGQFAVSIGLIICTSVIYAQTVYARTADPGYKRDHLLQVEGLSRYQLINSGKMIADRMRRIEGVDAVGRTGIGVATDNNNNTGVMIPGNPKPVTIGNYNVDSGFKDAMGLQLVAGRWFQENRPMDEANLHFPNDPEEEKALAARGTNVVINELGAQRLGYKNSKDILGKQFRAGLVDNEIGLVPVTVIGVVKDARFRSMRAPLEPIMFIGSQFGQQQMIVRYHGDPMAVRGRIEQAWAGITREIPFQAKFDDEIVGELYKADDARAKTFAGFAVLAVVIGCLGLFGLASFTAERRTKEIGIRKVLGARTQDIVRLLVWQFSQPVLIANLIAWPVAWWVMRGWLNSFDARIGLNPALFIGAGALAMIIAAGTIIGHAMKVARANPIHALRYE